MLWSANPVAKDVAEGRTISAYSLKTTIILICQGSKMKMKTRNQNKSLLGSKDAASQVFMKLLRNPVKKQNKQKNMLVLTGTNPPRHNAPSNAWTHLFIINFIGSKLAAETNRPPTKSH